MTTLEDIFAADGPLARSLPGFRARRTQREMAEAVADALAHRGTLVVEAGTGTGKTFAYLIPAMLSGRRVAVSTGTRTLQDQLFNKDVPLLAETLGRPLRLALLKGRANYLCLYRFERAGAQRVLDAVRHPEPLLETVGRWSGQTRTGDLAEVPGLTEASALWPQITSTRENCLGARCPRFSDCWVFDARRSAQEADLVVVNHHLFLADLALKEEGFGDLLGSVDAVILDEAHQLPDLATQSFGSSVGSRKLESLMDDAQAALAAAGASSAAIAESLRDLRGAISATLAVLPRPGRGRGARDGAAGEGGSGTVRTAWEDLDTDLESFCLGVAAATRGLGERVAAVGDWPAVQQCAARARELAESLEEIALAPGGAGARTVESTGRHFSIGLLPLDVAQRFAEVMRAHPAAWVFTSATLSVGEDFSHFESRLGIASAETRRFASPFDFETQALLYLPAGLPEANSEAHTAAVIDAAAPLLEASQGGAFLLFTSHRALARAAVLLRDRYAGVTDWPILVQGESPREMLLRRFREAGNAVLLGTSSFWEGVDVQGRALRLVVIEKLPFASPDDPLVKARIEHAKREGGNAFRDYQLPEAVIALKQGAGRLIRSEDDAGVIMLCDPRLTTRSYGRTFLASLPPMPVTREAAEARRFLARLA